MAKDKDIEILGLNLKIGKKEIQLTIEEAETLFNKLEKMFGSKIIYRDYYHYHRDYSYPRWYWKDSITSNNCNNPLITSTCNTANTTSTVYMDYKTKRLNMEVS